MVLLFLWMKKNEIIIFLHPYIGDQLYALSCLDIIHDTRPDTVIIVYAPDGNKEIIDTYKGIDEVNYIQKNRSFRYKSILYLTK